MNLISTRSLASLWFCTSLIATGFGASGPRDVTDQFIVPKGLQVTVWAKAPQFFNPTNIDIDARGRVWIAEAVNYRNFRNKQQEQPDALYHPGGDRIMILDDTDGDGTADRSKVFVQDKDLTAPLGLAVIGSRVFVSCSPNLILYTDTDGDDRSDKKEIVLTGFGGFDHDHGLHALVTGPDGRGYFTVGNAGPHIVVDRSGWTLRAGGWYSGGTPYNTKNTPGLKSDDGRVWVGGVAMRIHPDGTGLAVVGHNFRNSYEVCLDSFGNVWQNDNDDTISCRTTWLMEGGNAGYSSADGTRSWQADKRPGQPIPIAHWRQEDPGVIPSGDVYGPGAPTGIVFYENGAFSNEYTGTLLSCEAGRNVVWGYRPERTGAGFQLKRFRFLSSVPDDNPNYVWHDKPSDPKKWFRPSDVAVGPDGAIYVADWFDPIVGGHQMVDTDGAATIYRIAPRGKRLVVPTVDWSTVAGQVRALKNPAVHVRACAFDALTNRAESAVPAVRQLLADPSLYFRARAIWLLARLGATGLAEVEQCLQSGEPSLRITAFRALRQMQSHVLDHAAVLAKDPSPAVRREVAIALRDVPLEKCRSILLELAEGYDGQDRWYLEALGMAFEGKEEAMYPELAERMGSQPEDWSDAFCGIVWRLHPIGAVDALARRAASNRLPAPARRQAIDALAFINHRTAAQRMLQLALNGPDDLRSYAAWWIRHRDTNDWSAYGIGQQLNRPISPKAPQPPGEPAYVSPVMTKGGVDIDIDITDARHLWLVVGDAANGNSRDCADWAEPRLLRPNDELKLTELSWAYADSGWGQIQLNKNCKGGPLHVGHQPILYGIGTHANSTLVYDLPGNNWTHFRAYAGVDVGGATERGSDHSTKTASLRFAVYHDGPSPRQRAVLDTKRLLSDDVTDREKQDLVIRMAGTSEAGAALIHLIARGQFPDQFKPLVAQHIFQNPDLAVRALASEYFSRPGRDSDPLPPIRVLAQRQGNAERGRSVFFGERAGCSRCHVCVGQGGEIGPDLTQIRTKYDRVQLLDAILNPSAAILAGYEAWTIVTENGLVYSGYLLGDGDPVVIKDTEGRQHAIPRSAIVERQPQKQSLMPGNVALGLERQELADLLDFLLMPPVPTK